MIKFNEWYFPDGEKHLPHWMRTVGTTVAGRLTYQYGKYDACKPFIKEWRTAIDVGAHIGLWSYFMADDFEELIAFEPMPEHQECWNKNMHDIDNAVMHPCALGAGQQMVTLETRTEGSSGDTQVMAGLPGGDVEMYTLDSFDFQDVDFIKIDTEGYEDFILRGGVELLARCKPCIIVEQKGDMSERYGLEKLSAVTLLEGMGAVLRAETSGDYILSWD